MTMVVYVVECAKGYFYVGRCERERLPERLEEHR